MNFYVEHITWNLAESIINELYTEKKSLIGLNSNSDKKDESEFSS